MFEEKKFTTFLFLFFYYLTHVALFLFFLTTGGQGEGQYLILADRGEGWSETSHMHNRFKALILLWTLRPIDQITLGANAVKII